jgi:AraC-like DNA-binding protein
MQEPATDALLSLDLTDVDVHHRETAWRDWMRSSFPEFSLARIVSPAHGRTQAMCIGDARLWLMHCPAGRIRRTPDPRSPLDAFIGVLLSGSSSITRDGQCHRLEAHEVIVGRVAPGGAEMSAEVPTSFVLLELPARTLFARYPQFEQLQFHVCREDQPGAALVRELLLGAVTARSRLGEPERRVVLAAVLELLILLLDGVQPKRPSAQRVDRTVSQIKERLADPALTANTLAREQGLSRRRLDELFMTGLGLTVAAFIVDVRMARAAQMLRDPQCRRVSILVVAARVGFRDASHFSRTFKSWFGAAPKFWRARELKRGPEHEGSTDGQPRRGE